VDKLLVDDIMDDAQLLSCKRDFGLGMVGTGLGPYQDHEEFYRSDSQISKLLVLTGMS
jgi:hypothetical protein